jgi:hypothetical protein
MLRASAKEITERAWAMSNSQNFKYELPDAELSLFIPNHDTSGELASFEFDLPDPDCSLFIQAYDGAQQFTIFGELPLELRRIIWKKCLPPSRLVMFDRIQFSFPFHPVILTVNSESRHEALRYYKKVKLEEEEDLPWLVPHYWLSPTRDTFAISALNLNLVHGFVDWEDESTPFFDHYITKWNRLGGLMKRAEKTTPNFFNGIEELHVIEMGWEEWHLCKCKLCVDVRTSFMRFLLIFKGIKRLIFHCNRDFAERGREFLETSKRSLINGVVPEFDIYGPNAMLSEPQITPSGDPYPEYKCRWSV